MQVLRHGCRCLCPPSHLHSQPFSFLINKLSLLLFLTLVSDPVHCLGIQASWHFIRCPWDILGSTLWSPIHSVMPDFLFWQNASYIIRHLWGLVTMALWLRMVLLSQKTQVRFPAPTSAIPQPPLALVPKDLDPFCSLCIPGMNVVHRNSHRPAHIHINKNK